MDIINHSGLQTLASLAITGVEDSKGGSLPNPGTTSDTELTLSGDGTPSSVVAFLDNGSPVGTASVTTNGTWEKSVTAELGRHEFGVREGATNWQSWVITVEAEVALPPTIDRVNGSWWDVDNGGFTPDTTVTLYGTGTPGYVDIYDGTTYMGSVPVNGNAWSYTATGLQVRAHGFTARNSIENTVSGEWRFDVILVERQEHFRELSNQVIPGGGSLRFDYLTVINGGANPAGSSLEKTLSPVSTGCIRCNNATGQIARYVFSFHHFCHRFALNIEPPALQQFTTVEIVNVDGTVLATRPCDAYGLSYDGGRQRIKELRFSHVTGTGGAWSMAHWITLYF